MCSPADAPRRTSVVKHVHLPAHAAQNVWRCTRPCRCAGRVIAHRPRAVQIRPTIGVHFSAAPPRGARSPPRRPYPGTKRGPGLCARLCGLCAGSQSLNIAGSGDSCLLVQPISDHLRFGREPLKVGRVEVMFGGNITGYVIG